MQHRTLEQTCIAAVLHHTGEIIEHSKIRSCNTDIPTYELITSGLNSGSYRHMIRLLNRAHRHVRDIHDYLICLRQYPRRKPQHPTSAKSSAPK